MTQTVKIKRSAATASPVSLAQGEMAYSAVSDHLFIGEPGSGTVILVGGKRFTDMLDHTAGTVTPSSALIVDASSKLDILNVDNITLNGNAITSTNVNGDISITPNGTGDLVLDGMAWPQADGGAGQFLKTDGLGQLSWDSLPASSWTISGDTGSDTFSTGETLTYSGGTSVSTTITDNVVTINADVATTVARGVASFAAADFTVTAGAVEIKAGGVTNTQLVNSEITLAADGGAGFTKALGSTLTISGGTNVTTTTAGGVVTVNGLSDTAIRGLFSAGTGVGLASGVISIGQAVGVTDDVTFNDVTVNGNFTVNGTVTTVNTETLTVDDNIVVLNNNVTGVPTENGGIEIERGTSLNVAVLWNETTDEWEFTNDGSTYNSMLTTEMAQDIVGAMFSGNTETNIAATYQDADGTIDLVVATATTGSLGVASFDPLYFGVTAGAVTIENIDGGTF